ncbi:MAG: hypothetical protein AB7N76_29155 [Planctomycetota bacterium]
MKRTLTTLLLALTAFAAAPAMAQDRHHRDARPAARSAQQQGQVWVPAHYTFEERTVVVTQGYYRTTYREVQVPGRWEERPQTVTIPGYWTTTSRPGVGARVQLGPVTLGVRGHAHGQRWVPARTETRTVRVWVPGRCERQPVREWVAPVTRTERVRVLVPGHWEACAAPAPRTVTPECEAPAQPRPAAQPQERETGRRRHYERPRHDRGTRLVVEIR